MIDVTQPPYNADRTGTKDSTAAIRAAIAASLVAGFSKQPVTGGFFYTTNPAIYFPAGLYTISATLPAAVDMVGDGRAVILAANNTFDLFANQNIWRIRVSNLSFVGGANQFNIGNNNIDAGLFLFEKCVFENAANCAIRTNPSFVTNPIAGGNSTMMTIRDCEFLTCNQAVVSWPDFTTIEDCWVTSALTMFKQGVFENRGQVLVVRGLRGIPGVTPVNDQWWITNYGTGIKLVDCRIGGERGGMCPVVNFTKYRDASPFLPSFVKIEDCPFLFGLGNPLKQCIVYCYEIPNQIFIEGNGGMVGIVPVIIDSSIAVSLGTYFGNLTPVQNLLAYRANLTNVQLVPGWTWPTAMQPFVV